MAIEALAHRLSRCRLYLFQDHGEQGDHQPAHRAIPGKIPNDGNNHPQKPLLSTELWQCGRVPHARA